jgi:hypothetical protein
MYYIIDFNLSLTFYFGQYILKVLCSLLRVRWPSDFTCKKCNSKQKHKKYTLVHLKKIVARKRRKFCVFKNTQF